MPQQPSDRTRLDIVSGIGVGGDAKRNGGRLPRDKLVPHSVSQGDRPDSDGVPSKPRKYSPRHAENYSASVIFRGDNLMQLPEFTRALRRCGGPCWWPVYLRLLSLRCSGLST